MKNIFLLVVGLALSLNFGLAQTPSPATTSASIKGCIGGTDGAYTLAQDGSTQSLKITDSTVDLKPHVGHQVELTGKRSTAAGSGTADTVSVTAVAMISEHCPTASASNPPAADPSATATATTPSNPASAQVATNATEPMVETKPAETKPAETASTPVMASSTTALPNTAPPSLKAVKVTGKVADDGKTFVGDKDGKSWTLDNPEAVKGHEGHHVTLTAQLDAAKSEVHVVSLKMAK